MIQNRTPVRRRIGAVAALVALGALATSAHAAEVRNIDPWTLTSYDSVRLFESTPQAYAPVVRNGSPRGAVWLSASSTPDPGERGQFDSGLDEVAPTAMPAAQWLGAGADREGTELIIGLTNDGFVEFAAAPDGTRVAGDVIASAPPEKVTNPELAVAANGDAILAWQQLGGATRNVYVIRRDGSWSEPQSLPARAGSVIRGGRVRVDISDDGRAILGWLDAPQGRSIGRGVRVGLIEEGQVEPVIHDISPRGGRVDEFDVSVAPRRSLVVWTAPKNAAPTRVLMRVGEGADFRPQKAIGRSVQITPDVNADGRVSGSSLEAGLSTTGAGFIVWAQQLGRSTNADGNVDVRVVGKRIRPNGIFTKAVEITPRQSVIDKEMVRIGMDVGPLGSAVLSVQSFVADGARLDAVTAAPGRRFGAPVELSSGGDDRTTTPPVVDARRAGGGGIMWQSGTGSTSAVPVAAHTGPEAAVVQALRTFGGRLQQSGGGRLEIDIDRSTHVAVTLRRTNGVYQHAFVTQLASGSNTVALGRFASAQQLPPGNYRVSVDTGGTSVLERPLRVLR